MAAPKTQAPIKVVSIGLGAIGTAALEHCLRHGPFEVVAAVDPAKGGESVAGIQVLSDIVELATVDADVALVATGSSLISIRDQLERACESGHDVVSTCEELAYPWLGANEEVATRLDEIACQSDKTILGCGVNPGFVMDVMPAMLGTATLSPRSVTVERRADLSRRREQLRQKCGVGMNEVAWRREAVQLGHRGLVESAYLCAIGLGWHPKDVEFNRDPVVGEGSVVKGIHETAELNTEEGGRVTLELVFEMDGQDSDRITIDGSPPLEVVFEAGVHGERATVARFVSSARVVRSLPAGIRLPIEVPSWTGS